MRGGTASGRRPEIDSDSLQSNCCRYVDFNFKARIGQTRYADQSACRRVTVAPVRRHAVRSFEKSVHVSGEFSNNNNIVPRSAGRSERFTDILHSDDVLTEHIFTRTGNRVRFGIRALCIQLTAGLAGDENELHPGWYGRYLRVGGGLVECLRVYAVYVGLLVLCVQSSD